MGREGNKSSKKPAEGQDKHYKERIQLNINFYFYFYIVSTLIDISGKAQIII